LLSGEIQAPAFDAIQARASLQGENFQLLDVASMRLRVNPDLQFAYSPGQASIEGRLQIPQARAQVRQLPAGGVRPSTDEVITGDQAARDTGYLNLALDVELELGSDVEFQGFGLTTGLTGSLEIQQPAGEPRRTFGTIELVGGEYEAYGRTLVVQRGRMIFQGEIDNPGLDVDAEQDYREYRVGIHLGGTALNPSTTLYSYPTMTQSDILAVLLTGQRLETMSAAEAPTLLSAATQLGIVGGSAIADRIEESFGLSEFGVRDDAQNGQSIVAGAYLLPRLYVEWAQGLFEPSSSLELEYRISDQWKLRARSGASQSMDLIYEIETE
jgi:translocation and assembly module TamB